MMAPACLKSKTLQSTMLSILILVTSNLLSKATIEKIAIVFFRTVDLLKLNTLIMAMKTITSEDLAAKFLRSEELVVFTAPEQASNYFLLLPCFPRTVAKLLGWSETNAKLHENDAYWLLTHITTNLTP